jgi:hypothetical protein
MKKLTLTFFLLLFITGCGLSDNTVSKINSVQELYKSAEEAYTGKKAKFEAFKKTADFKLKFTSYYKVEKWDKEFTTAKLYLNQAKELNKSLTKLLKEDDSNKESTIERKIVDLERKIMDASEHYYKVQSRISFLTQVMNEAPVIRKNSISKESEINTIYDNLAKHFKLTEKDYPSKSKDLDLKLIAVKKLKDDSSHLLTIVEKEFAKKSSNINYALLGDSGEAITANLKKIQYMDKSLRKKTSELYKSYTKILKDMKIEAYVVIGRSSWDSGSDWDTSPDHKYKPKLVDEKTANFFDPLTESIATFGIGWGNRNTFVLKIPQSMWNKLGISPKESWPTYHGDDEAEYWVENIEYKFYHKYVLIENDKSKKTDWIEISESVFNANEANLGMEIVSKPYGFYESEKINTAAPIGMSTVGNPKYGKWEEKKDPSTGQTNSFWHYYGMYSFFGDMMGSNHYYSRYDYDDYNRNYRTYNRSYYGSRKEYGTWGSKTHSNKAFSSSRYVKKHYSSTNGKTRKSSSTNGKTRKSSSTNGRTRKSSSTNGKTRGKSSARSSTKTSRNSGSRSRGRGPGGGGK